MQIEKIHIKEIKRRYNELSTKEDLVNLLNHINFLLYDKDVKLIKLKSLTYYSNPKLAKDAYKEFTIPKKSGGVRKINAPKTGLKGIQKPLSILLQCVFDVHPAATGFVNNKSIVDNAKPHVAKTYVFNIDLKDFFPSIDKPRFWKRLQFKPFDLNEEKDRLELANRISAICFTNLEVERKQDGEWVKVNRDVLPQGAPTSPVITNIIAYRLDEKLAELANKYGCTYTRYADDITFSSMHNVYQRKSDFRIELEAIINGQNFHIKHKKTRLNKENDRQEVTGLVVNKKVNVRRRYVKELRHWIYFWEKYGHEKAEELITKAYVNDKGYIKGDSPNIEHVIFGKLEYLKMVKGSSNSTYKKLKRRFDILTGDAVNYDTSRLLEIWENAGIENAMQYYNECNKKVDPRSSKLNLDLPVIATINLEEL